MKSNYWQRPTSRTTDSMMPLALEAGVASRLASRCPEVVDGLSPPLSASLGVPGTWSRDNHATPQLRSCAAIIASWLATRHAGPCRLGRHLSGCARVCVRLEIKSLIDVRGAGVFHATNLPSIMRPDRVASSGVAVRQLVSSLRSLLSHGSN